MLLVSSQAFAHSVGESYIFLSSQADKLDGRLEIRLQDFDERLRFDVDGNGNVEREEFLAGGDRAIEYVRNRVTLIIDGLEEPMNYGTPDVLDTDLGRYAVLPFSLERGVTNEIDIEYTVLFDVFPEHRGLLILEYDHVSGTQNTTEAVSLVFRPGNSRQVFDPSTPSTRAQFFTFVREGMHHIWIGVDHILFLIVLILPSVMRRRDGRWEVVDGFRPAFMHVAKVVSLFTLAHSITLSLAALGLVSLNSRVVESIIAASVVFAAVNGGFLGRKVWPIIFAFGLFHGFGFATVMGHLTLDRRFLVPALLGFNVGVEIGQLAIVLATFPVLWLIREWRHYRVVVLQAGSTAIAALALIWLVERAFDITLLGIF